MNVQEQIKVLKEQISSSQELLTKLEDQIKKEQEFPQKFDDYWYIDVGVEVEVKKTYYNHYVDERRQEIGNIFRTKEQAEFAVEKLKVEAELRKFSTNFVLYKENWFLSLADTRKDVMPLYEHRNDTQGVIYFESREKAEEAMDTVGEERIKKYIFEVE